MPRRPAAITQADVARAVRAVAQTGYAGVIEITRDGTIRIIPAPADKKPPAPALDDDDDIEL